MWVESSDDIFSEDEAAPVGWARDGTEGSDGAEESIAMSLTSQLSLSDRGSRHSGDAMTGRCCNTVRHRGMGTEPMGTILIRAS